MMRQEEALRMEVQAYYAAKRGASRKLATQTLTNLSSMEKGLLSETKTYIQPTSMQSGEQPISSEGQSEDMGPWTGATEEPSSRTRLGGNHLGDEGAELVGEALKRNSSKSVNQVLMEATKVTDKGKKKLQEICDFINSGRDTENKLDLNYKHHSEVVQKRNSTNYLYFL
ncbi:uncharacterized protein LOC135346087 isoform X3 [Halichondria panicea]